MNGLTESNLTPTVIAQVRSGDERTKRVLTALIQHLHDFVRAVEPSETEWWSAIDFLTRTGQACDDRRQEFVLLSDMLGVTSLIDFINHRAAAGVTETTVTGPFHRTQNVPRSLGDNIAGGPELTRGEPTLVRGRVLDVAGRPIAGAAIDVWQADDAGYYDVQDENQPEINLRGLFTAAADGSYWFRTIRPSSYPVPTDGPVGALLQAMGRHPMRPAHIHFMVSAPGYRRLVTHAFVAGDEYLDSDAAFAVKRSLVVPFIRQAAPSEIARYGFAGPFLVAEFDFILERLPAPIN